MEAVPGKVFMADPTPPETLVPGFPRDLAVIISKAMSKERERRYATAQDMAADLRRFLAGEPILARPETQAARIFRRVRRNWFLWCLCGFMSLVAGASIFFSWRTIREQEREEALQVERRAEERRRLKRREAARSKVQEAVSLRSTGGVEPALAKFADALLVDGDCYEAFLERGRLFKEQGRYSEALQDLARAVKLQSRAPEAYVERVKIAICRKDYLQALFDVKLLQQLTPDHPFLATAQGSLSFLQGNREEALRGFTDAIRRNPKSSIAYAFRGGLLLTDETADRREEGMDDIRRALALDRDNPVALNFEAMHALSRRNFDQALLSATAALKGDPLFPEAHILLGKAYLGKASLAQALASLNDAVRFGPNHQEAWKVRALVHLRAGAPEKALEDALRGGQLGADAEMTLYMKAVALARLWRTSEAWDVVRELEERYKDSVLAAIARGEACLAEDRLDEALKAAEWAVQQAPNSAQALELRGLVKFARGENVGATTDLTRAARMELSLAIDTQELIKRREKRRK